MSDRPSPRPRSDVVAHLRAGGPALVALSGGVDSSVVAALAVEGLGRHALAVTLSGPAVARVEVDRARRVARTVGIEHHVLGVDPVDRAEYRENPANRCYFCRSIETAAIRAFAAPRGAFHYLDGIHIDDLADDRPGVRAMEEAGFTHPLVWGGWSKREVRATARELGLPNWDAPSDACLASRIAHGEPISHDLLERIELAEAIVRERGFRRVRVRVRSGTARVEVDPEEVPRLVVEPMMAELRAALRSVGLGEITFDPWGYGARRSPEAKPS